MATALIVSGSVVAFDELTGTDMAEKITELLTELLDAKISGNYAALEASLAKLQDFNDMIKGRLH